VEESEHRGVAAATYNRCWELLEMPHRSHEDDVELLSTAFASRYHWKFAGAEEQWVMADWMVSRAAAAVDETSLAISFAQLANDAVTTFEAPDWLLASCAEGLARAYAAAGQVKQRDEWYAVAERFVALIEDEESRELIAGQLASVPT
jgi:hypothetical protein